MESPGPESARLRSQLCCPMGELGAGAPGAHPPHSDLPGQGRCLGVGVGGGEELLRHLHSAR